MSQPATADPHGRAVLMVTWAVGHEFGGMTTMCLKRAGLFHDRSIPSAVVSFDPNPDLDAIRTALVANGRLHPAVPLLNLHEYYAARIPAAVSGQAPVFRNNGTQWEESARQPRSVDGSLQFIAYRCREDDRLSLREYFRPDGSIYLLDSTLPSHKDPDTVDRRLQLLAADGTVAKEFVGASRLYRHWLTELVDATDADVIIDSKFAAGFLFSWKHPSALKVVNFHSTHVAAGQDTLTGKLSVSHGKIIANRDAWDGITFLTDSQRNAFVRRFGPGSNTLVISNPVDGPAELPAFGSRDPAKVLHVGRFTKGKNIAAVINIVNTVAASNTPVHLDLIGDGAERPALEEHVRALGIEELVTFHGHVNDVPRHLSTARVLLLCSKYEGQSLAVLEAQAHGCVPVAFDVDFGPRDVIEDRRNGFLVPYGDEGTAAAALATLLTDDGLCEQMSARGFESAKEHTSDQIFTQWKEALEMVRVNKKTREELAGATAHLAGIRFHADGDMDLDVAIENGTVELEGLALLITERGSDATEGVRFAPYQDTDGTYGFRLPAGLRAQLPGSDALDVNVVLEAAGMSRTLRLGAARKPTSVPYFTAYGNLSFK